MARKKVTLAYITKDSERKASYKKRKKGLIKKVSELSTLCGVDACAIIYSEFDPEPVVWPSPEEARRVVTRFNELPEMDKTRLMENQMSFTRNRIEKATNKLRRLKKENKRKQLANFMYQCIQGKADLQSFDIRDTGEMLVVIDDALRDITARIESMKVTGQDQDTPVADLVKNGAEAEAAEAAAAAAAASAAAVAEAVKEAEAALVSQPSFAGENQGLLDEIETMGMSYMSLLLSPRNDIADFGWKNDALMLPPYVLHGGPSTPAPPPPPMLPPYFFTGESSTPAPGPAAPGPDDFN